MANKKNRGRERILGVFGDELIAEYNWFDFSNNIALGDTQSLIAWSMIDLYDYSPSEQAKRGRVPYLRHMDFMFVPAVTFTLIVANGRGANPAFNLNINLQIQDDKGEAALDEPTAAEINQEECIALGYFNIQNGVAVLDTAVGYIPPDFFVVTKDRIGMEPVMYDVPLSSALSMAVSSSCYAAAAAAIACPGFWIGKAVVAWKHRSVERLTDEKLVKESE